MPRPQIFACVQGSLCFQLWSSDGADLVLIWEGPQKLEYIDKGVRELGLREAVLILIVRDGLLLFNGEIMALRTCSESVL